MAKNNSMIDEFTDKDLVQTKLNFWNYKENKVLVGQFLRQEEDQYGEHAVLLTDGVEVHIPNLTALNSKMMKASEGNAVKIEYLGEVRSEKSGRMYSDFKVWIK